MTIGVLFVCTGNICRSPMAVGVFRAMVRRAGLAEALRIDSAGTSVGHVGQSASLLAVEAAKRRGYDLAGHRARILSGEDIERFDYPLAMDRSHLAVMRRMAPRTQIDRPQMFLKFLPDARSLDVPDPYGGGARDYEQALDLIEKGCAGLLAALTPFAATAIRDRARPDASPR
ncbi:MAG: low molecular weight phosphotyrosine protein phosphatase [Proteobacteria bacterium]|nr:low molecular weight phosphotyrosine protein phosphatase [Pseudomonadota bacterium]